MDTENTNFLIETLECLRDFEKQPQDVLWCCINDKWFTFDDFMEVAQGFNYDSGYGVPKVNMDLKIVGNDWWLERYEYDGAERWVFKTRPVKPNTYKKPFDF